MHLFSNGITLQYLCHIPGEAVLLVVRTGEDRACPAQRLHHTLQHSDEHNLEILNTATFPVARSMDPDEKACMGLDT